MTGTSGSSWTLLVISKTSSGGNSLEIPLHHVGSTLAVAETMGEEAA